MVKINHIKKLHYINYMQRKIFEVTEDQNIAVFSVMLFREGMVVMMNY